MEKIYINNKGLSLVEVVISSLIVSVLMAGLYAAHISARNITALAMHKAVALAWVTSKIEGEKNDMRVAYTDPSDVNIISDDDGPGPRPGTYQRNASAGVNTTGLAQTMRRHVAIATWLE